MPKRPHEPSSEQSSSAVIPTSQNAILGYIKEMVPKDPKNDFFKFIMQTSPETAESTICFDPSKRRRIKEFHESRSPVQFINFQLNEQPENGYLSRIVLNCMTTITTPEENKISFEYTPPAIQFSDISSLPDLKDGTHVSVRGYVKADFSKARLQRCHNGKLRMILENCLVTDSTGVIKATFLGRSNKQPRRSLRPMHETCFNNKHEITLLYARETPYLHQLYKSNPLRGQDRNSDQDESDSWHHIGRIPTPEDPHTKYCYAISIYSLLFLSSVPQENHRFHFAQDH